MKPMMTVTYAIGDIHGRVDLLDRLLAMIEADAGARGAAAKIVFTGDYVDRGADSFAVVERLIAGPRRPGDTFVCLRGNHDDLFVQAVTVGEGLPDWAVLLHRHARLSYDNGGEEPRRALLRHADYLAGLPLTHDDETNLFVHAAFAPGWRSPTSSTRTCYGSARSFWTMACRSRDESCTATPSWATSPSSPSTGCRSIPAPIGRAS